MQNEAAQLVAESLLGIHFRTILINNKAYTVYPPTVKIMCRGLLEWAKLDIDLENPTKMSVISQIPGNAEPILRGLSYFVTGDVRGYRWKAYRLFRKWSRGTPAIGFKEMSEAVQVVMDLMPGQDFFDCATSCMNAAKMVATTKS